MKVYLSVPLAANRNRRRARAMARAIAETGNTLTSPWVLEDYTAPDAQAVNVFERDRRGAEDCDVIVADVSSPSIGVGMEVMSAHLKGRKVVVARRRGRAVSGMVMHMRGRILLEFESEAELRSKLAETLLGLSRGQT